MRWSAGDGNPGAGKKVAVARGIRSKIKGASFGLLLRLFETVASYAAAE
jgi:hypothetical protein